MPVTAQGFVGSLLSGYSTIPIKSGTAESFTPLSLVKTEAVWHSVLQAAGAFFVTQTRWIEAAA